MATPLTVCAIAMAAALTSAACRSRSTTKAKETPPAPADAASAAGVLVETRTAQVDKLLAGLARGVDDVERAAGAGELTPGEIAALLRAAPSTTIPEGHADPQEAILRGLSDVEGHAGYVPILEEIVPRLRDDHRGAALALMVRCPGGLDALVRLAPRYPAHLDEALAPLVEPDALPSAADRRRILALAADPVLVDSIASLAIAWAHPHLIDRAELTEHASALVAGYRAVHARRLASATAASDDGEDTEQLEGIYLDLFYYLPDPIVAAELEAAASDADPMVAVFAVASIARRGGTPTPAAMDAVASRDGVRWILYNLLAHDGKQALVPARWRTQEALARADLAHWLSFGTELGKAPDEMTLMKVIPIDAGADGMLDLYVFRFRTKPPHWAAKDDWLAGVAGPYPRRGGPSIDGRGTFSSFEPAASRTPEGHAGHIEDILRDWRAHAP